MLLADTEMEHMKHPVLFILREMDRLKNELDMASSDLDYAKKGISALRFKSKGIGHAQQALSAASEGVAAAREYYVQTEAVVLKSIENSMAWCRAGRHSALEKPFSIQATQQRLDGMKKCLHNAFIAMDLGIGRTEDAEGMSCHDGNFWKYDSRLLWVDCGGDPALPNIMWHMRDAEMAIQQAYDIAHHTAVRIDDFRPKGHVKIVYSPLKVGWYWEKEKEDRLEKQRDVGLPEKKSWEEKTGESAQEKAGSISAQEKQTDKISLRKRLQVAEKESHLRFPHISISEKSSRVSETER